MLQQNRFLRSLWVFGLLIPRLLRILSPKTVIASYRRLKLKTALPGIYFGRHLSSVPTNSVIFFPVSTLRLSCGIAGIVAFKKESAAGPETDLEPILRTVTEIESKDLMTCVENGDRRLSAAYLCGEDIVTELLEKARTLKTERLFYEISTNPGHRNLVSEIAGRVNSLIERDSAALKTLMGTLTPDSVDTAAQRIDCLKDTVWCLQTELLENIDRTLSLLNAKETQASFEKLALYKRVNSILNSIDRLEVRGRDSAGLSLLIEIPDKDYRSFLQGLVDAGLQDEFEKRQSERLLTNRSITLGSGKTGSSTLCLTYKIAAEIGSLGDNVQFLREEIRQDRILQMLAAFSLHRYSLSAHTRWASVGAITESNCHPVDNRADGKSSTSIIHVCLNGDIDNFLELKKNLQDEDYSIPEEITTDTKIIPLQIQKYIAKGDDIETAFRKAVNDFEGSHAISMHTDLAPGKIFLAQKGSGQAIFVGLGKDYYLPTSEAYGFVEETPEYIKLDGDKPLDEPDGKPQGQIFILNGNSTGGLEGMRAFYYNGTPVTLSSNDIKRSAITSRDIDRQHFPHYFLKEITEAPESVEKTLQNRWKIVDRNRNLYGVTLGRSVIPENLEKSLSDGSIRRIFFIGQGTAGVAAKACANLLDYYLNEPALQISALKSSEFSGFKVLEDDESKHLNDCLVVAISQSGTTTDTNRTVDMVRQKGAATLAIVNRRDSDLTFKTDGVLYTSSGRDIEMSVASTKAFYAQIMAGALLGLYIAKLRKRRAPSFISEEIKTLLEIPGAMRQVLELGPEIQNSAQRLATTKTYWAAVGSGPNKASADEIRIKLSELCYKTISSDYVEDKKHIDLSSEPLIIVCAAGTRGNVLGDIVKDTAIFQAHKATPVVIADKGENRFNGYAENVFHVPAVGEHLAPVLNTLAGHLWGYHAALSLNEGSRMLFRFREEIQKTIETFSEKGLDVYEVVLEKTFREKIARFYQTFRKMKIEKRLPAILGIDVASDLTLLLKYLAGRLPVSDFEIDFGIKGTAANMLDKLISTLSESINIMARPIDAIKHQAKTVTVGTSRIREKVEGILFEALADHGMNISQLINRNILVIRYLQEIIAEIPGSILYRISGLNLLGEPTDETTIEIIRKDGVLKPIPSRVETDPRLKGTKRIIAREGNVYIGKGRKDDRSIIVIPLLSLSPDTSNFIEYILLLNVNFKKDIALETKIRALGGKFERIKNIVQENSLTWKDTFLEMVKTEELFGMSAEKIGELIASKAN